MRSTAAYWAHSKALKYLVLHNLDYFFFFSYLVEHQSMERQAECQHQVKEQHYDTDQCSHDLPKHHNIDANTLKPGEAGDYQLVASTP